MTDKIAKLLKNAASGCLGGTKMFLTMSVLSDEKETDFRSALKNWGDLMTAWAGIGAFLMGAPYCFAIMVGAEYGVWSGILVLAGYFFAIAAIPLACALICAVAALMCWLVSIPFDICLLSEEIKKQKYKSVYQRIYGNLRDSQNTVLQLSEQDLKYIANHPEIIKNQTLKDLQTGKMKLSLPDNVDFDEKFLSRFMTNGKKMCIWDRPYYGPVKHECNWKTCDSSCCQLSHKALKHRETEIAKEKEAIAVAKNTFVQKVYGNKYMANMCR